MADHLSSATDTTGIKQERSYIFLKILSEEQKCVSGSLLTSQNLATKYSSPNELQSFFPNIEQDTDLQCEVSENMINTRQATDRKGYKTSGCFPRNSVTHLDIPHNSKQNGSLMRTTTSKIEGRKAPGANRILPLITSVWEDTELHWKRQKSPKAGGGRRDSKGKLSHSNKKNVQGTVTLDEGSEEEEWSERREIDDHGGSIYRAYADFFMAEEVGEDREDCICSECGAEFLTATHVALHLEDLHNKGGVKLHQCFVCRRKRYPALMQLNQHLSEAHGIPHPQLTCRTCFMELAGESEAKAHSRKHQTPYKCSRCPLSHSQNGHSASIPRFATRFLLAEHMREIHLPRERPYVCSICGRHFIHQFVRDLHMQRRHQAHTLICPEVRHCSPSPFQEIVSVKPRDSPSCALVNPFVFTTLTSRINRTSLGGEESYRRANSFLENKGQSISCKQNQTYVDIARDKSEKLPGNLRLTQQQSSFCCSKGSFIFPDEVSLLRHVFLSHDKTLRLQLLKCAREADREDTLFEGLWKAYLNISSKQNSLNITVSEENQVESCIDRTPLTKSEKLSINIYSLNKIYIDKNVAMNAAGRSSIPMIHDKSSQLSQVVSCSNNCSDDKVLLPNNAILTAILPQHITQTLQYNTDLASMSSKGGLLHGKCHTESTFSAIENAFDAAPVDAMAHQTTSNIESQKNKDSTKLSEISAEEAQPNIEIPDSINFCLMDILDSVCDVFNGSLSQKELRNRSGNNSHQRSLSSVRCLLCRYLASNPLALERHRRRRHFRNKHCPFCSLACSSVDAVWRHVSDMHLSSPNKSKAEENITTEGPEELQQKIQSQKLSQSSSGLRCPVCKKVFSSRGKCNSHQENVHKVEVVSRPLSCSICSKKFQFQKALERHHLLHSQDKVEDKTEIPYSCPHCEQTFLRPGFLKRHIASHFEDVRKEGKGKAIVAKGPLGHSCPSCSRRLPTHAKLKAHIRTSHPPSHLRQRFGCNQCPVRCNTASGLRVHMRVHTGERPFPCSICDMSFKRQTALRKHIVAVHTVPSESSALETVGSFLKCPNCMSSFRDRSNLVRHFLQVHRGLRRFVCGLCGAKYGQNQDLRRHLKGNHGVDAPRIIGSDRRSVDQIYVVPPVIDDLPSDHPLANKIRAIVEEEERKLDEDSLPHFTETPQQLHLHIHKEPVVNAESVFEENKDAEPLSYNAHESIKLSESASAKRSSRVLNDHDLDKSNENRNIEHGFILNENKKHLESDSAAIEPSLRVETLIEQKESSDKNISLPPRNLILDALISSQISTDVLHLGSNILSMEEGSQIGQVYDSNCIVAKTLESSRTKATEMNIIMTKQSLNSDAQLKTSQVRSFHNSVNEKPKASSAKIDSKHAKEQTRNTAAPVAAGSFSCCHCGKEFIDAARLERHTKVHSDLKPHVCSVCGKSFVEKYNLKVHMRSHTGERPYKCEVCDKRVRYLKELADHRRMHLGERPHVCNICSRAFLRLRDLQRHLQIHLSRKKHQCPICNKEFSRLDHLRAVHMRIHEPWRSEISKKSKISERTPESLSNTDGPQINGVVKNPVERCPDNENESSPYQCFECKNCKKKFSSRTKLDKHLVLHSGEKVHKCSACGRSFALASYLRAHQNTHRKQQGYLQCPKCPRRFVSPETLSVHDEKFHQRIEKMKKFQSSEPNEKAGRSKDVTMDICDEERFFNSRTGDFDVNLNLEDEMNIQEVELFDPASLSESEKRNTFVYLHVISDDLLLANESSLIE